MRSLMTIEQCIISNTILSVKEADEVYNDLNQLDTKGIWDMPEWATDLENHYRVYGAAHPVIVLAGWKAVAKAYREKISIDKTRNDLETCGN